MALHTFSDDGNMGWTCPHCGGENTAHVSHPQVQYADDIFYDAVALPKCECGTQTFLKVKFSDQELKAPNMVDRDGNPTPSHEVAHRHIALAAQVQQALPEGHAVGRAPSGDLCSAEYQYEQPQAQYPKMPEPAPQEEGNVSDAEAPMPSRCIVQANPLAGLNA